MNIEIKLNKPTTNKQHRYIMHLNKQPLTHTQNQKKQKTMENP